MSNLGLLFEYNFNRKSFNWINYFRPYLKFVKNRSVVEICVGENSINSAANRAQFGD
jgi:hypothetical protein